jgi:hypothetical protein
LDENAIRETIATKTKKDDLGSLPAVILKWTWNKFHAVQIKTRSAMLSTLRGFPRGL